MIFDAESTLSKKQAITTTAASTNSIDRGEGGGVDKTLRLLIMVTEAFTAGGSATLTVDLQDSADNSSFATVESSGAIAVADLVLGYKVKLDMPQSLRRYIRLNYTVATGPMTGGKVISGLVTDIHSNF